MKKISTRTTTWSPTLPTKNANIYTTREAARLLGVSVPTVQQLVESGILAAWKTSGGHRRIPESALRAYLQQQFETSPLSDTTLSLIVADQDSAPWQRAFEKILSPGLALRTTLCTSGYDALLEIGLQRPSIIIISLNHEEIDGKTVLNRLASASRFSHCHLAGIAEIKGQEQQVERLWGGVTLLEKPLDYRILRCYLNACLASSQRSSQTMHPISY